MKNTAILFLLFFSRLILYSQEKQTVDQPLRSDWWGDVPGFLNDQADVSLANASITLAKYPPGSVEKLQRGMALLLIDNVLHQEKSPSFPAVKDFLMDRISKAADEIRNTQVKKGAVIWKLYNHSFVVKTASVTIGFDIQRGYRYGEDFAISGNLIKSIIDATDVLFISHLHGDHTDAWITGMFLDQGKPVIAPPGIFKELPVYNRILHPERIAHKVQQVELPLKNVTLKTVVYPGHQGEAILNNVYLISTPEGLTFIHTGDQSNNNDFEWINRINEHHRVDVLMANCWTPLPERMKNGIRPAVIIPGHENEMGHTVDHREPFWLNQRRLGAGDSFPVIEMVWGERFFYLPKNYKMKN